MNSTILSIVALWSFLGADVYENPYYSDFSSSECIVAKEDIDDSMMPSLIGQWCDSERSANVPLSVSMSRIGDVTFLSIPSYVLDGKMVIIPLKRDALRLGNRIPCWITYLPKDSEMSNESLKSFGKSGKYGWIDATEGKITLTLTKLRRTECANWFSTTCPLIGAIRIPQGRSVFWELLSKHKMEMIQDMDNVVWTLTRFPDPNSTSH